MIKKGVITIAKKTSIKSETNPPENFDQAKILIIDDERLLRQSIQKILEKAGFYCESASDYNSARKAVGNLQFDLILADIVLPKMDGLTLIGKLQEEYKFPSALIFLTGEPNLETALAAIKLGASDYLEKPVERSVLIEAIKRALVKHRHKIAVLGEMEIKSIAVNESILKPNKWEIFEESKEEFFDSVEKMHNALLDLKKKYGEEFNDEQRALLNQIAQSNASLKKIAKKMEE